MRARRSRASRYELPPAQSIAAGGRPIAARNEARQRRAAGEMRARAKPDRGGLPTRARLFFFPFSPYLGGDANRGRSPHRKNSKKTAGNKKRAAKFFARFFLRGVRGAKPPAYNASEASTAKTARVESTKRPEGSER